MNTKNSKQNTIEAVANSLETVNDGPLRKSNSKGTNFADRKFLDEANPVDYINDDVKSSKHDGERETEIQNGLPMLASLVLAGVTLNPLLILLAKWWECKPARKAIKDMIDAEAIEKGHDPAFYLQNILGKEVETISQLQSAIDRVRYAKTYFKPRKEINAKVITKPVKIDGLVYNVPVAQFEEAKVQFANDKEALKQAVLGFSTLVDESIESL